MGNKHHFNDGNYLIPESQQWINHPGRKSITKEQISKTLLN